MQNLQVLSDKHASLVATLQQFEFVSAATKASRDASSSVAQFAVLCGAVRGSSDDTKPFATRLVCDAFGALATPCKIKLAAALDALAWPRAKLDLTTANLNRFNAALANLLDLHDLVAKANVHTESFIDPLHLVFQEVEVHFKYHFYLQKETNRMDKPEWMLRYVLKITEDHEPFLNLIQDMLDEREGNTLDVQTEYISFLLGFLKNRIKIQAFQLMDDSTLFSHLITQVMRFDKTMQQVHRYYGGGANSATSTRSSGGRLLDVFCEEPELFGCWLAIERE
ncbi:hypothetical protein HDU98_001317, partial [Podochytrium sp. JEL0797]